MAPRPILKPKCHTCRRRRIQCDYGRPTCQKCKEDGRECEGYDRDLVFVHVQDQVRVPRRRRKQSQAQGKSDQQNQVTAALNVTPSTASIYGDMMMDEYLDYLAPGRTLIESPSLFWLSGISAARRRFPPLDLAAKALNIIAIGRSKRVDTALLDALPLYGQAMAGLRNWHVNYKKLQRTCWREALMTSLIFHMFETFDYGPPSAASLGFNNHVEGVTALLHLGGPQILTDPIFRSVFVFARISIWSRGILGGGGRTPPMVEWASKTWGPTLQNEPTYLFDILMPLPFFYQEAKRLAKEQHTFDEFAYIKLEIARLTSSLSQWHQEAMDRQREELFQREDSESPRDPPKSPTPAFCISPPSVAEPHGQILFTSSPNGASMMYYWTSQIFMYSSAIEAFKTSPWATDEDLRQTRAGDDPEEPTLWDLANKAAENICNASNFFFNRRSSGLAGIQLTMVPLAAVREFYVKHGESMDPFDDVTDNYIYALERLLPSAPRAESETRAMQDGSVSKFQQVMSNYGFWFSVPLMPRG